MTDNELYAALRMQMLKQLSEAGIDVHVVAGFQATKQGREDNFVMFFPIAEGAAGWQGRNYNIVGRDAGHRETQLSEKTLQVQAFMTGDTSPTACDVTAMVRMIVNSLPFVEALRKKGVGIQRATNIRTPYFVNDRGDYEFNPSFDFTVSFQRDLFPNTAATTALAPKIISV